MFRSRSTGSIIRNALYNKSNGLSSHQLGDLTALSYDTKGLLELEAQLYARLSKLSMVFNSSLALEMNQHAQKAHNSPKSQANQNRNSKGYISLVQSPTSPLQLTKSKTVDFLYGSIKPSIIDTFSSHFRTDINITVLKCLTIIIHLCQTGSPEFFTWLVSSYRVLILPIRNLVFNEPLSRAIQQKASLVIEYCEDSKVLAQARTFGKSLKRQLQPGIVSQA